MPAYQYEQFHHAQGNPLNKPGFSVGAIASVSLSDKTEVRFGAGLVRKAFEVEWDWDIQDPMDPLIPITTEYRANYIQIPILVDYEMGALVPSVGLQMLVLADSKVLSMMGDDSETELDVAEVVWNEFTIHPRVAMAYEVLVGPDTRLRLEPYFLFDFQSLSEGYLKDSTPTIGAWMQFAWAF